MAKKNINKRALVAGVLSLLLCVSMLVGSTFAWFTDSATTGVTNIQSGELKIDLGTLDGETFTSVKDSTVNFVKADDTTEILWEPGCTYQLPDLYVRNMGNLAFKYKVVITGVEGDAKLNEAIEWTIDYGYETGDSEGHMLGTDTLSKAITVSGHMKEEAGNEYQGLSITGITVTVLATQDTVEYDSEDNQYDADAEFETLAKPIYTVEELSEALDAGDETITLGSDLTLQTVFTFSGKRSIDLNGFTLTAGDRSVTIENGDVTLSNGTINYSGTSDAPVMVRGTSNVVIEEVIINVGTSLEDNQFSSPSGIIVNQGSGSVVTMNSGEINVHGKDGSGVYVSYATPDKTNVGNHTFNFNGGTINVNTDEDSIGIECLSSNTLNLNGGVINMNDSTNGYAFNVGQDSSTRTATVVKGNGTVVNLFGDTNKLCADNDMPQFENLGLTVNEK